MDDGIKLPASNFDFRTCSLDRKLGTVSAQSGERIEARHRAACTAGPDGAADVFRVRAAEALRDEAVERLAHGSGGRTAEHLLRRFIEKNDALIFIHSDYCVHRG